MKNGEMPRQYHLDIYITIKALLQGDSGSHLSNLLLEAGQSPAPAQVTCGFVAETGKTLLTEVSALHLIWDDQ